MSSNSASVVEEASFTPFLKKLTIFCSGGPFLDGYILIIIGAALVQLGQNMHLNAYMTGIVGAASLAGLFLGGAVFGYVTDLVGRKVMYTIDLVAIVIASILQIFITNVTELVILRFFIGLVVGADYPIATSLLAEFSPKSHRAMMLGILQIMWFAGATIADFVGYFLLDVTNGWKWMLSSAAIPAIILIIGRWNTPESPRWLMSKNRVDEAREVVKQVYGPGADIDSLEQNSEKTRYSKIFEKGYLSRVIFCGGFWLFSVAPLFAMYTFGPTILQTFNLGSGKKAMLGDSILSLVFIIGCVIALIIVNKIGRRTMIIWSFVLMTLGMMILAVFSNASSWVIMIGFAIYAIASGGPNILDWIYPNELFPTEIRASAVGAATAISRIGACIGTFALPSMLAGIGIVKTMGIMTAVTFAGLLLCIVLAPETKDLTLSQAAMVSKNHSV